MNDMSKSGAGGGGDGGGGKPRRVHPGAGRRSARSFQRGRLLRQEDVDAVVRLIGPGPYQRPLLIEYLHKIQDAEGCLPAAHMHGLAELMRIPMAEVFEVATFYAHFDVVDDGEERPAKITVRVCDSLSCMMAGAEQLLEALNTAKLEDVRVVRAPCLGSCATAPAVHVCHNHVDNASLAKVKKLVSHGATHAELIDYQDYESYVAAGGYKILKECLSGKRSVDSVVALMSDAGLRGLGGAGLRGAKHRPAQCTSRVVHLRRLQQLPTRR